MQTLPTLPPHTALFLDFDGTLVALADQPEQVVVPPELLPLLVHLQTRLGGALALVSGRRLQDLDQFLAPLQLPAAAEHGAIRRTAQGDVYSAPTPHLAAIEMAMHSLVSRHPGLRLEPKQTSLALHYRHAPALAALCHDTLVTALHGRPDLTLLHGKCVLEVKPAHIGKGQAIAAFMQEPPFTGRVPVFAGDDVTDEAGFVAVHTLQGRTVKVGAGPTCAQHRFDNPAALLDWLHTLLQQH